MEIKINKEELKQVAEVEIRCNIDMEEIIWNWGQALTKNIHNDDEISYLSCCYDNFESWDDKDRDLIIEIMETYELDEASTNDWLKELKKEKQESKGQ